ncbi:zinc-ribbon domain-containing protein [Streptomyces sp. NPDC059564]|uniref:zinc-ribbon domain-containing protein n=1 Tax=Streptomyces sp. NPDC059564 TaxID=3346865 RepID=UPI003674F97E
MPRTFPVSLAQAYPQLVALWHPDRNGSLTPDRVGTGGGKVWWRCPAGHEWEETVISRRSLPKWKGGDVTACRECSGFKVRRVFPECGCVKMVQPGTREAERAQCYQCRAREFEENAPRVKAELAAAAKAAAGRAERLLDTVPLPGALPVGLAVEWRYWAAGEVRGAMAAEQVLAKSGEPERALQRVMAVAERSIPALEACTAAAAQDGVVKILGRAYWAEGWCYLLSGEPREPLGAEHLAALRGHLEGWLEDWAQHVREEREAGRRVPATTAEVTAALTGEIREFLHGLDDGAMVYGEVRVPVVPDGKTRYGRLDLVGWLPSPAIPDFVVEIDSAPNPSSLQKLKFVRDAGAVPLWVRFGTGGLEEVAGVGVIDAREAVRAATGV